MSDANDPILDLPAHGCFLRILGALEVRWGDVLVDVGPPKQRAVLALLLLRANEVVSSDALIDQLWEGRPPRTAAHSVQIYVSELRRAFGKVPDGPTIVTCRPGYRLDIDPGAVDIHSFGLLAHRGIDAARSGDIRRGRAALRDALTVWRTPPLADFTYDDWAQPHIARLQQIHLGVVEELAAIELEVGNHPEAIRLIGEVTDADPLRERATGLQMTALYRSGNHVEALRSFTRYRHRLAEEVGVVPSPEMERLYEQVLSHDPALLPVEDEPGSSGASQEPSEGSRLSFDQGAAVKQPTRETRSRLVAFVGVLALTVFTLAYTLSARGGDQGKAVLLTNEHHEIGALLNRGFDRAVSEFEYRSSKIRRAGDESTHETEIRDVLASKPRLVINTDIFVDLMSLARAYPDVLFVSLDEVVDAPNVASWLVNTHEGSYLAGVAAALTTKTGAIAFLGGVDEELIWEFSGGFIAGARSIDPGIRVTTTYLADIPHWAEGYANPVLGEEKARELYLNGADVIFAAAGESGLGVFRAAADISEVTGIHRWVVGVDTDQYETIGDLPGLGYENASILREHILTSVIKGFDQVIFDTMAADSQEALEPGVQLVGLAEGAIDISYSGGYLDRARDRIEAIRQHILDGDIDVPCRPPDRIGHSTPERPHPCNVSAAPRPSS